MTVEMSRVGRVAVARLVGDIDMSSASSISAALRTGLPNDVAGLVLDLTDVQYLDSAGVQMLFDVSRSLSVSRRKLGVVVAEDAPVRAVIKIAHVDEAASVCATVDECVGALSTPD